MAETPAPKVIEPTRSQAVVLGEKQPDNLGRDFNSIFTQDGLALFASEPNDRYKQLKAITETLTSQLGSTSHHALYQSELTQKLQLMKKTETYSGSELIAAVLNHLPYVAFNHEGMPTARSLEGWTGDRVRQIQTKYETMKKYGYHFGLVADGANGNSLPDLGSALAATIITDHLGNFDRPGDRELSQAFALANNVLAAANSTFHLDMAVSATAVLTTPDGKAHIAHSGHTMVYAINHNRESARLLAIPAIGGFQHVANGNINLDEFANNNLLRHLAETPSSVTDVPFTVSTHQLKRGDTIILGTKGILWPTRENSQIEHSLITAGQQLNQELNSLAKTSGAPASQTERQNLTATALAQGIWNILNMHNALGGAPESTIRALYQDLPPEKDTDKDLAVIVMQPRIP